MIEKPVKPHLPEHSLMKTLLFVMTRINAKKIGIDPDKIVQCYIPNLFEDRRTA